MDMTDSGMIYVISIKAGHMILPAKGIVIQNLCAECKKHGVSPNFNDERKVKMLDD